MAHGLAGGTAGWLGDKSSCGIVFQVLLEKPPLEGCPQGLPNLAVALHIKKAEGAGVRGRPGRLSIRAERAAACRDHRVSDLAPPGLSLLPSGMWTALNTEV